MEAISFGPMLLGISVPVLRCIPSVPIYWLLTSRGKYDVVPRMNMPWR